MFYGSDMGAGDATGHLSVLKYCHCFALDSDISLSLPERTDNRDVILNKNLGRQKQSSDNYQYLVDLINLCLNTHSLSVTNKGSYYRDVIRVFLRRGKKARSLTFLLTYLALKNRPFSFDRDKHAMELAGHLELTHRATLIYDDIVDGSPSRNGKPTLAREIGPHSAQELVDVLLSRVYSCIPQRKIFEFSNALNIAFYGHQAESKIQLDEIISNREDGFRELLWIIETKSGALGELSLRQAFEHAKIEAPKDTKKIALNLAYAYQLMNDVSDIGYYANCNKIQFKDLQNGRVNIPILWAAIAAEYNGDYRLHNYYLDRNVGYSNAKQALIEFLPRRKVIDLALFYLNNAASLIRSYLPNNSYTSLLVKMLLEDLKEQYLNGGQLSVAS